MARIRTIKPEFWTDEAVMLCKPLTRLFFIGMWNQADDYGRLDYALMTLKARIFPNDQLEIDALKAMVDELCSNDLLLVYSANGKNYIQITGWHNQKIDKRQVSKIPAPFDDVTQQIPPTPADLPRTPPTPAPVKEGNGEERKEDIPVAGATRDAIDEAFEEFWRAYPKRDGANPKVPAAKLFRAAVRAGAPAAEIVAGARQCAVTDAKDVGTPYIPQAVRWLRDKRWRDYQSAAAEAARAAEAHAATVLVKCETPQWEAWQAFLKATQGRGSPRSPTHDGWHFPSEWPPDQQHQ